MVSAEQFHNSIDLTPYPLVLGTVVVDAAVEDLL